MFLFFAADKDSFFILLGSRTAQFYFAWEPYLSLAALDINLSTSGASGSGIGSSTPRATVVGRASCSIFDDVDEEYM